MKTIKLTQNQVALVSDEDYEHLNQWRWYAMKVGDVFYAVRSKRESGKRKTIYMHKIICPGKEIDHKNGDTLNNTRENLRSCTHSQNLQNRRKYGSSSQYKGVSWDKKAKKWAARIMINQKYIHLGYFTNEEKAAKAYDTAAREIFGDFARLNF